LCREIQLVRRQNWAAWYIEHIDLALGHELVDFNRALALQRDRLEFFRIDFDVFALADLVTLNDVARLDFVARIRIDLAVLDPIAGVLVELMEADFLSL